MNFPSRLPLQRPPNASPQQFSSTPTNQRFFVPRFGHSSIPSYPRPRSSASKPNPDCYALPLDDSFSAMPYDYSESNSMMNNCGSIRGDESVSNGSFQSPNSSAYFTCNDTFIDSPKISPRVADYSAPSFQTQAKNNNGFSKKFQPRNKRYFSEKQPFSFQKNRINKKPSGMKNVWQCSLCSLSFNSGIPYDMHIRGLKHAKKLKMADLNETIQKKVEEGNVRAATGASFRCEVCNVEANSSVTLLEHLKGNKHKTKASQAAATDAEKEPGASAEKKKKNKPKIEAMDTTENCVLTELDIPTESGKSNGTLRCLEDKSNKFSRLTCDTCCVVVNSTVQLQQHLSSKKHLAKVGQKKVVFKTEEEKEKEQNQPVLPTENTSNTEMQL